MQLMSRDPHSDKSGKAEGIVAKRNNLSTIANTIVFDNLRLLCASDAHVRRIAEDTVRSRFREWEAQIIDALQCPDPQVRAGAACALAFSSSLSPQLFSAFQAALGDADEWVRYYACEALAQLKTCVHGGLLASVLPRLADPCWHVRRAAIDAAAAICSADAVLVDEIARRLNDDQWNVRAEAATALQGMTGVTTDAVEQLCRALCDTEWQVRAAAASALGKHCAVRLIPNLPMLISDPSYDVRRHILNALPAASLYSDEGIQAILNNLSSSFDFLRSAARDALLRIGPRVVDALTRALEDPNAILRAEAATALGWLGAGNVNATKALERCVADDDLHVRICAAEAMWRITRDNSTAMPVLTELLTSTDEAVRQHAIQSIGRLGRAGVAAERKLIDIISTASDPARELAIIALARLRIDSREAVAALTGVLREGSLELRLASTRAIGLLGRTALLAVPLLQEQLQSEDEELQIASSRALRRIQRRINCVRSAEGRGVPRAAGKPGSRDQVEGEGPSATSSDRHTSGRN
jgi:HEAT repeat protein